MVMPGGISAEQALMAMEVGEHVTMEIVKYPKQGKVEIKFMKINAADNFDPTLIMDVLAGQLREQMYKYFKIKGKMVTQL